MRLVSRAIPVLLVVSLGLAGCGGYDSPPDSKAKNSKKAFEGDMPTAGSAEFTVGIPMS